MKPVHPHWYAFTVACLGMTQPLWQDIAAAWEDKI